MALKYTACFSELLKDPPLILLDRRVTCPACGAPLSDTNERPDAHEDLARHQPLRALWPEALAGEAIIELFLRGDSSF